MTTEKEPKRTSIHEPKALSTEYHKARKQLMLWAGILLVWEFVGIDLEKAKEAEGYAGALIKSIKSPQAVPWVLLILVGYFIFKLTVEWYQCNEVRRDMRVAKIDFISACVVSLLAYVLYFAQAISRVQFADIIQHSNSWQSFIIGISTSFPFIIHIYSHWRRRSFFDFQNSLVQLVVNYVLSLLFPLLMIIVSRAVFGISFNTLFVFLGFAFLPALEGLIILIFRQHEKRRTSH